MINFKSSATLNDASVNNIYLFLAYEVETWLEFRIELEFVLAAAAWCKTFRYTYVKFPFISPLD